MDKLCSILNTLNDELKQLYDELDNIDSTYYSKHTEIINKINNKLLEKQAIENLLFKG